MNGNKKPAARYKVEPKKKKGLKYVLLTLASVLVIFGCIVTVFLVFYKPDFNDVSGQGETYPDGAPVVDGMNGTIDEGDRKDRFYTFLFVGRDASSMNTDVIMLAAYDVPNKSVSILQIPRDTAITTESSHKRINYQHKFGYLNELDEGKNKDKAMDAGIKQLVSTVEKTFGIPVDQYAFVDLAGFRNIVDIIGGVEVDIPFDMEYSDPEQDFTISLKKGLTLLDGDKAEQLIRYRQSDDGSQYAQADIGRIKMRNIFLSAMIDKMLKSNLSQITQIAQQGMKHMKTDITAANMLYYVKEALKLSSENIRMHTAPGEGGSLYNLYADETVEIINKYYNPMKKDITGEDCDIADFDRKYTQQINIDGETVGSITEQQPDIPVIGAK